MADRNTDREALSFNGNLDAGTTGVKVTFTAPDNRVTVLRFYSLEEVPTNTAVIAVELELRGATKRQVESLNIGVLRSVFIAMQGGDKLTLNVTTADVGANFDWTFGFEFRGPNRNPVTAFGTVV